MKKTKKILSQTIITLLSLVLMGCTEKLNYKTFDYGTKSDSALFYFEKGWQEIMDYGRWTESEIAFRKASKLDSNWALGKSMIGRITRNLKERQQLLKELQKNKHSIVGDERLLLDVNILSLIAANNRDQGIKNTEEFNQNRWNLAENNFGDFARKYSEDNYIKAEYIELLHLNHGAQLALDSLQILATTEQRKLGFYLSYEASLELELGNLKKAIILSKELNTLLADSTYNSPLLLQTQIYKAQDSIIKAKELVDQIIVKDTNHLIALGMQRELENLLKSND